MSTYHNFTSGNHGFKIKHIPPPNNHKQDSGREQFGVSRVDLEDADDKRRSLAALDPSPAPMA